MILRSHPQIRIESFVASTGGGSGGCVSARKVAVVRVAGVASVQHGLLLIGDRRSRLSAEGSVVCRGKRNQKGHSAKEDATYELHRRFHCVEDYR